MDRNASHPRPLSFQVANNSGLAVITLTMTDAAVDACKRCRSCAAVSDPNDPARFVCSNVVPLAGRDYFLFGPGDSTPPAPTNAIDVAAQRLNAAILAEQEVINQEEALDIDDQEGFRAARKNLDSAITRARRVARKANERIGRNALVAGAIDADDNLLAVVPAELVARLWGDNGELIVPIAKAEIVRARR
jgi:hypothetical protein